MGAEIFRLSRPTLGPTQPPVKWVPRLSRGVKCGRGVTLTPHPLLVPWSRKSRAIPLLPLWAVRPVQSLSACTRVHFSKNRCTEYHNLPTDINEICPNLLHLYSDTKKKIGTRDVYKISLRACSCTRNGCVKPHATLGPENTFCQYSSSLFSS